VVLMAISQKNITSESVEPMNCKEVKLFIPLFVLSGQGMTLDECTALNDHIQSCSRCAKEYEETKFVIELVEYHRTGLVNNGIFSEPVEEYVERELTDEENLQEIWDKAKRGESRRRHNRNVEQVKHFVKASATIVVCLITGIFTWLAFSVHPKPLIPQKSAPQHVAFVSKPSVKIELVTKNGNILVPAKQQIASNDELKTLIIDGKHRLVMNSNTTLAVEPLVEHSNIGCLVKLASGRIYTHVEHDGNPFAVHTAHSKAVITGTTFDIKTTDTRTTLVVSEGTVQFESVNGLVKVAAGQTSEIVGQSVPTRPISCNAVELTAWAIGYKHKPAVVQVESSRDSWELPTSLRIEPIVLVETDYDRWVERELYWFKREFSWIFQLKDALAKEGIEVDYPELLIKTGDVWQFACLDVPDARFSVVNPNSLLKIVSSYGFNKQWLVEKVPAAKSALKKPILPENSFTGLKAFERWLEYLDERKGLEPPTPIYSYHASKYLANTRSLVWFAVRDGKYDLTDEECAEVLVLLQKEVTAACKCQNDELKPSCDDRCQESVNDVTRYIETMKNIEKRLQNITRVSGFTIETGFGRKESLLFHR